MNVKYNIFSLAADSIHRMQLPVHMTDRVAVNYVYHAATSCVVL